MNHNRHNTSIVNELNTACATIVGTMLLNLLSLGVTEWLQAHGHAAPILRSQNLPGAIEYNRELGKRYKGRLSRQLA